LESSKNK